MLQPNCSEVIAKLPMQSKKKAIEFLKENGFEVIPLDLFSLRFGRTLSIKEINNIVVDPENPFSLDIEHGSDIVLVKGDYGDGAGYYIRGHQHCQIQMYPTLERMADRMGLSLEGFDGGGDFDESFEEWKKDGRPAPSHSYQTNMNEELQLIFADEKIKKMTEDTMNVMDYVICKEEGHKEKVEFVKAAIKDFSESRRDMIIEKQRTSHLDNEALRNKTASKDELEKTLPPENKLFEEGQEKYLNIYGIIAFLVITNAQIRRILLGRDTLWQYKQKERNP